MVVDEDDINEIKPLPNLDYKIMQGNSLLDEYAGVTLLDERLLEPPEDKAAELEALSRQISEKSQEFVELHGQGKRAEAQKLAVEKDIKRLKKQKAALIEPKSPDAQPELEDQFSEARKKLALLKRLHEDFFNVFSPEEKKRKRAELERLEWEFMEATLREKGESRRPSGSEKAPPREPQTFFPLEIAFRGGVSEQGRVRRCACESTLCPPPG